MEGQIEGTFTGEIEITRNFNKHANLPFGKPTGRALMISTSPYAVVDIDMHEENKEPIRELFTDIIETADVKVVQTMSGGYHFYTLWDESFKPTKDSYVCAYESVEEGYRFAIDVFVPFA